MRKLSTLSLLVAAGIALNACGDTSDSSTPASEASADSQLTSVVAPVTASTSEAPEDSGPAPTLNDAPSGTPAADDNANPNPGGHNINVGQVGGACGYTNQGDKIRAGKNTSCEFAAAMFDEAIKHTFTWSQRSSTVNGSYNTRITAMSPATKQTYDLYCAMGSDTRTFYCGIDGDNSVYASFEEANRQTWTNRLSTEGQP